MLLDYTDVGIGFLEELQFSSVYLYSAIKWICHFKTMVISFPNGFYFLRMLSVLYKECTENSKLWCLWWLFSDVGFILKDFKRLGDSFIS